MAHHFFVTYFLRQLAGAHVDGLQGFWTAAGLFFQCIQFNSEFEPGSTAGTGSWYEVAQWRLNFRICPKRRVCKLKGCRY
jgi:hypothetical protein